MLKSVLLILALTVAPLAASAQTHEGHAHAAPANAAPATAALPAVTAGDRVLGRADAPVTVVEYASFVCSHCADWHTQVYPAFKTRFVDTGLVRLVFRDLPTPPIEVGARAAGIGRCAAPERFFDVASSLMNGQAALFEGAPVATWFANAVAVSGRTPAEIDACLAQPATLAAVRADRNGGVGAGVQGTPTFFVNGRMVEDSSLEGLSAAIQPLLPRQ